MTYRTFQINLKRYIRLLSLIILGSLCTAVNSEGSLISPKVTITNSETTGLIDDKSIPVIFFSDLQYAPKTGWKGSDEVGAVVTIWGRNFGEEGQRQDSFVSVGGIKLTKDRHYLDTWSERSNPVPWLESITFQLNSNMQEGKRKISLTVDGIESNSLPFTIGAGNIYYVSADSALSNTNGSFTKPFHCSDYIEALKPGDIVYWRGGTYNRQCHGGNAVIWYKKKFPSGTADKPISLISFPNEEATLDALTKGHITNFASAVKVKSPYITVAKFKMKATELGVQGTYHTRFIGNDIEGGKKFRSGTGIVVLGRDEGKALGNNIHGGRSKDKLDHAVYILGCSSTSTGNEVAYNYIYDNNFGALSGVKNTGFAAMIVVNHQSKRCAVNERLLSHRIHNNFISCEDYYARGIGIHDLSWDRGETSQPQPTLVYNNITLNCGVANAVYAADYAAAYHDNGNAVFFNNSFLNNHGMGFEMGGGKLNLETQLKNNVFTQLGTEEDCQDGKPETISHNAYWGCKPWGPNAVMNNPLITINKAGYDPVTLSPASPLIAAGDPSVKSVTINNEIFVVVERDFYGTLRGKDKVSIGAVEP